MLKQELHTLGKTQKWMIRCDQDHMKITKKIRNSVWMATETILQIILERKRIDEKSFDCPKGKKSKDTEKRWNFR